MMSYRRWSARCLIAVALVGAWGCGPSEPEVELAKVTGTVTLDGQKVTGGRVIFFNASGYSATADISADGVYTAETALGETEVFINHREPDITPPDGRAGMPMPGKSLVPDKYADGKTSGLKLTVQSGDNPFDIEMVSK
ncbi:MAG: hypothetical protein JNG89_12565 [Planctomycetaceae bacterium]|nr:hypothetical protein [Planctomycetaceae bacterium]